MRAKAFPSSVASICLRLAVVFNGKHWGNNSNQSTLKLLTVVEKCITDTRTTKHAYQCEKNQKNSKQKNSKTEFPICHRKLQNGSTCKFKAKFTQENIPYCKRHLENKKEFISVQKQFSNQPTQPNHQLPPLVSHLVLPLPMSLYFKQTNNL